MRRSRFRRSPGAAALLAMLVSTGCGLQQTGAGTLAAEDARGAAADASPGATTSDQAAGGVVGGTGSGTTTTAGGVVGGTGAGGGSGSTGGSTSSGSIGSGSSGSGSSGSGSTGSGSGSSGSGSGSGGGTPPVAGARPLEGELKFGYINVTGFDQLGRVVNVSTQSAGDARAQTAAVADWVNSHGGIGGKKLVPVVEDYNAMEASTAKDEAMCAKYADDHKVFGLVLFAAIHYQARDCYANKKVLSLDGSSYGFNAKFYESHAPYIWAPAFADYDQVSRALVKTLVARKWFAGDTKVGVVRWDDPPFKQVLEETLRPALKGAGVTEVVEAAVSNADIASIQGGLNAAIQTFNSQGVKRVFFLGSAPLQPFFFDQAKNQRASFIYSMTSYDSPRYQQEKTPALMAGAVGIGFSPTNDLYDEQFPFPQPGMETFCFREIYGKRGIEFKRRISPTSSTRQAVAYCENTLLLKHVADSLSGPLTVPAWAEKAERLGTSLQLASPFTTSFGPRNYTGAATYREMVWDTQCSCNRYVGPPLAFE